MKIRNKSIVSLINDGEVLLTEGYDTVREFRFFVPVGGGVEFGETIHEAAERELSEELGVKDQHLKFVNFHESLFTHMGTDFHEIMFHFICNVSNEIRSNLPSHVTESSGETVSFSWYSKLELEKIKANVVPPQIFGEIQNVL